MTSKGFRAFTLSKKSLQLSAAPETFKLIDKFLQHIPPLPRDFHNKTIILSDLFSYHYPILQNARYIDISHTNEVVLDRELAHLPNLHHIQFSGYTWTRQAENESVNRALMPETLEKSLTNQLLMPLEQSNIRFQLAHLYRDSDLFLNATDDTVINGWVKAQILYAN